MADESVPITTEEPVSAPFPGDTEYVPPPPEPTYIITIEELTASQQALQSKETSDLIKVNTFVNPDTIFVRTRLLQWASLGFPDIFVLSSVELIPPSTCLDGVKRNGYDYIQYLTNKTLSDHVRALEQKLPGMALSYSTPSNNIQIHVSKH